MTITPASAIELEKCYVLLLQEGLIENRMKEDILIDVQDVLAIKEANMSMSGGKHYCVLVTANDFNSVTNEARRLAASNEFQQRTIAKALLVHNAATRLIGNAYIRINRPTTPTRLFSEREAAIGWLLQMLRKNKTAQP